MAGHPGRAALGPGPRKRRRQQPPAHQPQRPARRPLQAAPCHSQRSAGYRERSPSPARGAVGLLRQQPPGHCPEKCPLVGEGDALGRRACAWPGSCVPALAPSWPTAPSLPVSHRCTPERGPPSPICEWERCVHRRHSSVPVPPGGAEPGPRVFPRAFANLHRKPRLTEKNERERKARDGLQDPAAGGHGF